MLSILVPVYNVEKYLSKCLDSLVLQSYPDIEIVLINDGSTDNSLQIAREYQALHPNIRIYSYQNSGISKTRNRALQHARGEFVMFVDSDDYIDQDMVKVMMEHLEKDDLDVIQCGFSMDYRFGKFLRPGSGCRNMTNIEALHALCQNRYFNNYPWGKIYRKTCFDGVEFPVDLPGFEDTYTIFKALANSSKAGTIPNRFYHYVQRRGSLTNRMSLKTVYLMRSAYQYQQDYLQNRFPQETFDFSLQMYNTDMVIIYTLIVFCHRKDNPRFYPASIDFSRLPVPFLWKFAYDAWLSIAKIKLSHKIME